MAWKKLSEHWCFHLRWIMISHMIAEKGWRFTCRHERQISPKALRNVSCWWKLDVGFRRFKPYDFWGRQSNSQEYSSNNLITIGNGLGILISHIGTVNIKIHQLKMNLISIQSMARNLNCKFILKWFKFVIKDNNSINFYYIELEVRVRKKWIIDG